MNVITTFLKKNPALLSKYVSLGITLMDKTVSPLNKLMIHLLEVQSIDPKTKPGQRAQEILNKVFDPQVTEEYDEDFNFSKFHTGLNKVTSKLNNLKLTADEFKRITDLSLIDDGSAPIKTVAIVKPDPIQELKEFLPALQVTTSNKPKSKKEVVKTFKKGPFRRVK